MDTPTPITAPTNPTSILHDLDDLDALLSKAAQAHAAKASAHKALQDATRQHIDANASVVDALYGFAAALRKHLCPTPQ
jgi:hypothetical protein